MKRIFSFLLPAALLCALLAACTDDDDQSQPRTTCGITFYDRTTYTPQEIDSLTVTIIGPDSILYSLSPKTSVSLPLRYVGDTSEFQFRRGNREPDTLTIVHKNIPRFISMEAGYAMYYELLKVSSTQHAIDTTTVSSTTITKNEQENISIYYPQY